MTQCYFCLHNTKEIDYKDTQTLKRFLSGQMKIYPRRKTNLCAKHQRQLKKAVKRARVLGLLPFVIR
ncbi:MAG TPA: 30S ribosomal protein S18 [Candidatus Paceibacterota bacterium]|nr:30S ribosomal protein S18 [Candidatus Paceibacterota bacterium]HPP64830.1 30S ribosomal protein S18 [Candidatus Paceibacterota bacterium]